MKFQEALSKSPKVRRPNWPESEYITQGPEGPHHFVDDDGNHYSISRCDVISDEWEPYFEKLNDEWFDHPPTEDGIYFLCCLEGRDRAPSISKEANIIIVEVRLSNSKHFPEIRLVCGQTWWSRPHHYAHPRNLRWRKLEVPAPPAGVDPSVDPPVDWDAGEP